MPNSNPTIERMMLILEALERASDGLTQAELVGQTGLARSTVYRMLNSLCECEILRETAPGRFVLGGRLIRLASRVTPGSDLISKIRFLQPVLDKLSWDIGQTCKLSVLERGAIMVVAGALARTPHAMSYTLGEYLPLHAGGASKVLMASLDRAGLEDLLGKRLPALTERTMTDRDRFAEELEKVKSQGWAEDTGEYSLSVCSFAAPVLDASGEIVAALSVPFMAGTPADQRDIILRETIAGAEKLSDEYNRLAGA